MSAEPEAGPLDEAGEEDGPAGEDGAAGEDAGDPDAAPDDAEPRRGRLRWPVMLLAAAVVAFLAIWQDTPAERVIQVRVAASSQAQQVQLLWLEGDGTLLRHSTHHFDGSAAERTIDSRLTAQPGTYRLNVRIRNARGERHREHRIDLREDTPVTVFAP